MPLPFDSSIKRRPPSTNWRQASNHSHNQQPIPVPATNSFNCARSEWFKPKRRLVSSSNFVLALVITTIIILSQLFIVHHYVGSPAKRGRLFSNFKSGATGLESLLTGSSWFCHSYPHLSLIAELADKFQVELVVVDPDLLELLSGASDEITSASGQQKERISNLEIDFSSKSKQEPSHKTIVHLAAINETSGGQPNLKLFYNALKSHYHLLKYEDASERMAPEVYRRRSHQLDDVHADALRDSGHMSEMMRQNHAGQLPDDFEISKIYTEFMTHLFVLSTTSQDSAARQRHKSSRECQMPANEIGTSKPSTFIVIHLFVLYNHEYRPEEEWIQSSLELDEMERHKLLVYGVHWIDFRVPLDHYYIHTKRDTSSLANYVFSNTMHHESEKPPICKLKVLEPDHLLNYANNTYLHCKKSLFNILGLIDGNRQISSYLKALDSAQPAASDRQRATLTDQVSIALQFMNVFSRTYGNFSYWLTGSSLLAYHKFCQLIALTPTATRTREQYSESVATGHDDENADDDDNLLSTDNYPIESDESSLGANDKTMLNLELGLFASEMNTSMLSDLSQAKMIGVTMISDWRKPNAQIALHVKDCPNLLINLHSYELRRDFYQYYYITSDNMIHNQKFIRRRRRLNESASIETDNKSPFMGPPQVTGHNVFTTRNLDLCWTRLDKLHPFRVPCDVHEHLRRIYVT